MYLLIYFRSAAMLKDMKTESKWVRYMIYEGSNTVYFHRFLAIFNFCWVIMDARWKIQQNLRPCMPKPSL